MEKNTDNSNNTNYNEITFDKLNLNKNTLDAITKRGYKVATEIQAKIIPIIFEQKNDVIGVAQTGTGKTGAFGLPLIDLIDERNKFPKAIILAPTRELALQVTSELDKFCGSKRLNILTVYGGSSINTQIKSLRRGTDIVVGTPGRVLDLLKRGDLVLRESRYFILDEADEMLNMGFIEDIELIFEASSPKRRVYLFSATMPQRIKDLSKKYMKKQVIIEAKKTRETNNLIEQVFYKARQSEKFDALSKLIDIQDFFYGIVFCRTKADVDNVSASLKKSGHEVDCIHGDIIQAKREKILKNFKDLKISILVATDVAARGIDIENLTHVINYNMPEDVESYTHRIGRTGRAGKKGVAISLVTPSEMRRISQIERTLRIKINSITLPTQKEIKQKTSSKFLFEIDKIIDNSDMTVNLLLAEDLLKKHTAEKLVSALLYKLQNKSYETSRSEKSRERGNSRRNSNSDDVRVFVARGKMDRMDRNGLINFIQKETKVRLGRVKDVKVCDKFSFITLSSNEAHNVVDAFEAQNRRRPLAEIAQN